MKIVWICVLGLLVEIAPSYAQKPKPNPGSATDKTAKGNPKPVISDTGKVIIRREEKLEHRRLDSIYQARIKMREIEGVYIPKDLNDCFKQLDELMDEEVREQFKALADGEADRRSHGTIGKWIEHKWSLTEGSRLSHYFNQMKVPHPDYMVGIILTSYHRHLNKKDLKLKEQVEHFRKLWQEKQRKEAQELIDNGKVKKQ